jgi:hypothetical protein
MVIVSENMQDWIDGTALSGTFEELMDISDILPDGMDQIADDFATIVDEKFRTNRDNFTLWDTDPKNLPTVGINSGLWIRRWADKKDANWDFIYVQNYGFDERFVISYLRGKGTRYSFDKPLDTTFFKDWFQNEAIKRYDEDTKMEYYEKQTETFLITGINFNKAYVLNWPLHDQLEILLEDC